MGVLMRKHFGALLIWLAVIAIQCAAQQTVVLVGSGSSVPIPLYARWAHEFNQRESGAQLRYVPLGTSEGIKQISHGIGDFGAGEVRLTAQQRAEGDILDLPVVVIAIVPIYNLPGIRQELRFSGPVLAEIFLGQITNWRSPELERLNPEVHFPDLPIKVVYRPAGKGSNYVFSEFLSKVSPKFRARIGVTPSPKWPVGLAAERSSDMAEKVASQPGSIGYVELEYAVKNKVTYGAVENQAGKFVKASLENISAACREVEAPEWNNLSASLTNAPGAESYPMSSFTWIYLRRKATDSARSAALLTLLHWMYSDGQPFATAEGYAQLPPPLLESVRKKISSLR
jgi:phosphate transport system substrate-binding protein